MDRLGLEPETIRTARVESNAVTNVTWAKLGFRLNVLVKIKCFTANIKKLELPLNLGTIGFTVPSRSE